MDSARIDPQRNLMLHLK